MKGFSPCLLLLDPERDTPLVAMPSGAPRWRWPGTGRRSLSPPPAPHAVGDGLRVDGARPAGSREAGRLLREGRVVQVGG